MTYNEIKEQLANYDVTDLIEMLQISSEEVVEAFSCKIEDMLPQLEELLDPHPITDVGVFTDSDNPYQQQMEKYID